jgi:hypothetical protein
VHFTSRNRQLDAVEGHYFGAPLAQALSGAERATQLAHPDGGALGRHPASGQWQRGWDIVIARLPVETDAVERVVLSVKAALLALERGLDDEAVALHERVVVEGHGMDQYWARIYMALLDVAVSARLRGQGEALRWRLAGKSGSRWRCWRSGPAGGDVPPSRCVPVSTLPTGNSPSGSERSARWSSRACRTA